MEIGDRVKDVITGLEGIATGKTEYLNGCRQFYVQPEGLKDGKPIEGVWVDEQQLSVTKRGIRPNPFAGSTAPVAGGPPSSRRRGE